MSVYDIVMLIIFGGAIWFGFWKGLAWQIASLAAIIISYIVAVNFRESVAQFIQVDEPWNRIGAMLMLFLGTSLIIWTIYSRVSKSIKKMELKSFDRQAGAVLGAVKGALLCMVVTMFSVTLLGERAHDAIHSSRTGPFVVTGITKVSAIVPEEVAKITQKYIDDFHDKIGHDGNLPKTEFFNPMFGANKKSTDGSSSQDPNELPPSAEAYKGQWNSPSTGESSGLTSSIWNRSSGTEANQPGGVQFGSTIGSGTPSSSQTAEGNLSSGNNGWPDLKFNVNSKELLDSAAEAAKRAFENTQQR